MHLSGPVSMMFPPDYRVKSRTEGHHHDLDTVGWPQHPPEGALDTRGGEGAYPDSGVRPRLRGGAEKIYPSSTRRRGVVGPGYLPLTLVLESRLWFVVSS